MLVAGSAAAQDFDFDPSLTQEQFNQFSLLAAQAIWASPIEPPGPRGIFGFSIGVGALGVPIDEDAPYWQRSVDVNEDFLYGGYFGVPRIVVTKGVGFANLSATYAMVPDTDISMIGGSIDVAVIDGGVLRPTLALRGVYSVLQGVDELDLTTYGGDLLLGKGFGPITPYGGVGIMRVDSEARIDPPFGLGPSFLLTSEEQTQRFVLGAKFSLGLAALTLEASEAEERTYAAKVSLGF